MARTSVKSSRRRGRKRSSSPKKSSESVATPSPRLRGASAVTARSGGVPSSPGHGFLRKRPDRVPIELERLTFGPFVHIDPTGWSVYEVLKTVFCAIFLMPIRAVLGTFFVVVASLICWICCAGRDILAPDASFHLHGRRRRIAQCAASVCCRIVLFVLGVHRIRVIRPSDPDAFIGPGSPGDWPARSAPRPVVANHTSWLDILVLISMGHYGYVAKSGVRNAPLVNYIAVAIDTVFVERRDKASRARIAAEISRRVQGLPWDGADGATEAPVVNSDEITVCGDADVPSPAAASAAVAADDTGSGSEDESDDTEADAAADVAAATAAAAGSGGAISRRAARRAARRARRAAAAEAMASAPPPVSRRAARGMTPLYLPLTIFPEGVTTNGHQIVGFRAGVFAPGHPVQPVALRYPCRHRSVGWEAEGFLRNFWRLTTEFCTHVEVEYLPVYYPDAAERASGIVYGASVARSLAAANGVETSRLTVWDKFYYTDYCNGKMTWEECVAASAAQSIRAVTGNSGLVATTIAAQHKQREQEATTPAAGARRGAGRDIRRIGAGARVNVSRAVSGLVRGPRSPRNRSGRFRLSLTPQH